MHVFVTGHSGWKGTELMGKSTQKASPCPHLLLYHTLALSASDSDSADGPIAES